MFIFARAEDFPQNSRALAGIMLKNNVKDKWSTLPPEVQEYILQNSPVQLASPHPTLRSTAGSIITTVYSKTGSAGWPWLINTLCEALDNANETLVDGAFSTLEKICEDHSRSLASDEVHRPLSVLVPKLIQMLRHQNERFRVYALSCLLYFIPDNPPGLLVHIGPMLEVRLFAYFP